MSFIQVNFVDQNGETVLYCSQPCCDVWMKILTSWMSWLCLSTFLLFMILTMAACRYILLSSSTAWCVCSTSWGVSFWMVPPIRNLVRLLVYFIFKLITDSDVSSWNRNCLSFSRKKCITKSYDLFWFSISSWGNFLFSFSSSHKSMHFSKFVRYF